MTPHPRRFPPEPLWGGAVAGACTLLSFALGNAVFGREYHFAALLPVFMMVCLLVAWSIHLRGDGFFRRHGGPRPGNGDGPDDDGSRRRTAPGPTASAPDLSLFAPRDDRLVPSAPFVSEKTMRDGGDSPDGKSGSGLRARARVGTVFLWSALELGVLSVLLRALTGAGSRYFGG